MAKTVIPDHIIGWFEKLKKNLLIFKTTKNDLSVDEQIQFIREQYMLLEIIISVLDDEMYFIGVRHDNIKKSGE